MQDCTENYHLKMSVKLSYLSITSSWNLPLTPGVNSHRRAGWARPLWDGRHHSSLQWALGLTRGSQKPLHRGTVGVAWMTPQLMHHCCSSSDVPLTPLQLHPTELNSFVLGPCRVDEVHFQVGDFNIGSVIRIKEKNSLAVRLSLCLPLSCVRPCCCGYTRWQTLHWKQRAVDVSNTTRGIKFFPNCVDECLNQRLSLSGFASLKSYDWMLIIFYSTSIVWRLHQMVTDVLRGWFCSFVLPLGHGPFEC